MGVVPQIYCNALLQWQQEVFGASGDFQSLRRAFAADVKHRITGILKTSGHEQFACIPQRKFDQ